MILTLSTVDSPIGPLGLATDGDGVLVGLSFRPRVKPEDDGANSGDGLRRTMAREHPGAELVEGAAPAAVTAALDAYFAGDREALTRVPWRVAGDGFQPRVWRALADIPAGQTISYGEMARRTGEPGAAQAAGVALNRNPIPLVLPCHRVVGADGAMVGFGGGVERKTWLLRLEGALLI